MNRAFGVIVFLAGLVGGFLIAQFNETTVLAQRAWDCKSFNMDLNQDTAGAIGGFLGSASQVQMAAAGVTVGQRYAVVACKQ